MDQAMATQSHAARIMTHATNAATEPRSCAQSLKICVAGSGAVGTVLAARLALVGHKVSVIARGQHLQAIQRSGIRLVDAHAPARSDLSIDVAASERAGFGIQDVVFVSVKAHSLRDILPSLTPLIAEKTIVIPALNGIPWWFFQGESSHHVQDETVSSVDPDGALQRLMPWHHLIGCVLYIAANVIEPGVVVSSNANRVILGELNGEGSERLKGLCWQLDRAGIQAVESLRIRDAVWIKLMANLATNPLSVVTEATLDVMHSDPGLRAVIRDIMLETQRVGRAYGAPIDVDIESLMNAGGGMGAFKTSMLQDFEKGRPLELSAIGDAVVELAARAQIAVPTIRHILSLTRFRSGHVSLRSAQQAVAKKLHSTEPTEGMT